MHLRPSILYNVAWNSFNAGVMRAMFWQHLELQDMLLHGVRRSVENEDDDLPQISLLQALLQSTLTSICRCGMTCTLCSLCQATAASLTFRLRVRLCTYSTTPGCDALRTAIEYSRWRSNRSGSYTCAIQFTFDKTRSRAESQQQQQHQWLLYLSDEEDLMYQSLNEFCQHCTKRCVGLAHAQSVSQRRTAITSGVVRHYRCHLKAACMPTCVIGG